MANEMIYSEATSLISGDPIAVSSIGGLFKKDSVEILEPGYKLGFKEHLENATGKAVTFTSVGGGMAATAGYQELGLTGIVGTNNTPLLNGKYDFKISVDGGAETDIVITVAGAPITYNALIILINVQLSGATASIVSGDIRITSDTTGAGSKIFLLADTENDLFGLLGASLETPVAGAVATSGYQEFGMTGVVGANNTPLTNGIYEFNIAINGTPSAISITVAGAPITYTALLGLINTALSGAVASINSGDIRITSSTSGVGSTIALTPKDYNDLFYKLSTTFDIAVAGINATSGHQEFGVTGKAGTDVLPDATYTLTVAVDGDLTPTALSFVASTSTLADLITAYNATLGATAVMSIVSGDLRITSAATGSSSTIAITAGETGGGETDLITYMAASMDIAINGANATGGYQEFGMTGVVGTGNTPLANGDYKFKIDVNGGATQNITITVSGSPITYTALLALINPAISGAVASIVGGDIRVTSSTTGTGSTILLAVKTNTDIFNPSALNTTVDTAVAGAAATSGYQELGLTGISGSINTPLLNGNCEFKIVVNGGATQDIKITVSGAPITYTALLALINAEVTGAVASIIGGDIRFTSSTTGAASTILLAKGENNLFAVLSASYEVPVDGLAAVNACAEISINGMAINTYDRCPLSPGTYKLSINIDGGGAQDYNIIIPIRPLGMEGFSWIEVASILNAITGASSIVYGGKLLVISDADTSIVLAEGGVITPDNYYGIVFKTSGGKHHWIFTSSTDRDNSFENIITQYGFKVLTT